MEKEEIMNIIWSKTPLDYRSKPDSPHHPSVLTLEKGGTTLVPLKTLTVPQLEVLAKKHMIELPGNPSGGQVVKGIKLSDEEYKDFVDYLNTFKPQEFTADDVSRWLKSRGNLGNPNRKWSGSQVWAASKQAGIPVDERDAIVEHYRVTGELPFQTWPALRLIESWPEQPPAHLFSQSGNPDVKRLGWGKQAFAEKPWGKGIVSLVKLANPEGGEDVWVVDYNDESVGKGLMSTSDFNKARDYFDGLDPTKGNPEKWAIYNSQEKGLWSNELGWVGDVQSADKFSDDEKDEIAKSNLPIGGVWIKVEDYRPQQGNPGNPGTGQLKGVEWPKAEVMINFDTKKAVVYPKDEFNTILNALKPDYDWPKHIPEIYRGEGDHYHAISPEKAISVDGGMVYATMELAGPGGVHLFLVTPKVTRKETLSQIVNDIKRERDVVYHTIYRVEFVTHSANPRNDLTNLHFNQLPADIQSSLRKLEGTQEGALFDIGDISHAWNGSDAEGRRSFLTRLGSAGGLQEVLEKEGDYIRQHGELTEADFSINDIQRDKIQAYWKLHPDAHIGLVNRYDRKRNFLQKYNGEKVLNFEWEFIIPQHDAELLKLLLAREQATYTGTQADVERLKPIWARIEQLGGLYLIWV